MVLLPGSRGGELKRHLPLFREIATRLATHEAVTGFVIPTLAHLSERLAAETRDWPVPVEIVSTAEARRTAFSGAVAALVSAGTVTLEVAMMDVPSAGTYVPDFLQMRAYRRWGQPLIGLPSIILGEEVVPEVLPGERHAERVSTEIIRLIEDEAARQHQLDGFARVRDQIVNGLPGIGRQSAALRVLAHAGWQKRIEKAGP